MQQDRSKLLTELQLQDSLHIDELPIAEAVAIMQRQDQVALDAVTKERPSITQAIELITTQLKAGGRLLYFGAGTSGRLGVLDASEIPPTFRAPATLVQGTIAGGMDALLVAQEGAEDSVDGGARDLDKKSPAKNDVVMGIAAGGTTPYVWGALNHAISLGCKTIFLSCVQPVPNEPKVDIVIRPLTGPEVVTGSTRLKAGTATKLVLNTLTTISMIQLGKVYGNLMVDLRCSNAKLWDRGARTISMVTSLPKDQALTLLQQANGHVKLAIAMHKLSLDPAAAQQALDRAQGRLAMALKNTI
ncbi:MAG TPA: N-acetylmuramic acid 6-phosphate etherase [Tepidisphaeraceae bacterium]|jgi:N-acetylmuramic acid 6-phosphate etherase|nr:N-acetylmuramic acid 6-phosphate etherase [Tepidisphaeraceae bacterium]